MPIENINRLAFEFHPLTIERWQDMEKLFGEKGEQAGCWCMWWRIPRQDFFKNWKAGNKVAFKALVDSGKTPGILAYYDGEPAGWCAIEPRENYPSLERSKTLKRIDDQPVWSITCFFVGKEFRGKGLTGALISAATEHARKHGARIVEGYPVEPEPGKKSASSGYLGAASTYERAGFKEAARPKERVRIMRKTVG